MFNIKRKKNEERSTKWTFGTMLISGIIGLIASFVLAIEEFHLLKNPDAVLSCTFNLILNCSTVMQTWQASVFGFPNMFIGLMAYPVVITVAIVALTHARLPRWFWLTANAGYLLGAIFAYWLFFSSVYVIEVLCPWCLIVTVITTILLATITHHNLRENNFAFSKPFNKKIQYILIKDIDKVVTACWILLLTALVLLQFGDSLFL